MSDSESTYLSEIGDLSPQENKDFLDCASTILNHLLRQTNENVHLEEHIRLIIKIINCHRQLRGQDYT